MMNYKFKRIFFFIYLYLLLMLFRQCSSGMLFLILKHIYRWNVFDQLSKYLNIYTSKKLFTECCSHVRVLTNQSNDKDLKAFGVYEIKPRTIIENHPVYINHKSGSHLVFSDYGWQVSNIITSKLRGIIRC